MEFLGIDLAAQRGNTATCLLRGDSVAVEVVDEARPKGGPSDDYLRAAMQRADWIAIDAPFGWPDGFAGRIATFTESGTWRGSSQIERHDYSELRLRETDRVIASRTRDEGRRRCDPLSVSSDSIGVVAFRAAGLLAAFAKPGTWEFERSGQSEQRRRVIEVYPAATLSLLGVRPQTAANSRGAAGRMLRVEYVQQLVEACGLELHATEAQLSTVVRTDHSFDAFVCATTAVLASDGRTRRPDEAKLDRAEREGWIHAPSPPTVEKLPVNP